MFARWRASFASREDSASAASRIAPASAWKEHRRRCSCMFPISSTPRKMQLVSPRPNICSTAIWASRSSPNLPRWLRKWSRCRHHQKNSCTSPRLPTSTHLPAPRHAFHPLATNGFRVLLSVLCAGEFLALQGSSGSGKSTLLNLLAGLDRPTSGAIRVEGRDLAALDAKELARYRRDTVGMVFQTFNLLPRMTLEENVELPLRLAEIDRAERSARVAEALERVRLGARRQHRPSELSGGEQQRGALARALVNRPRILFADEPTGNLDSVTGEQILLLLREIQDSLGMTIIMVTHERPLAERFANRIAVLSDGRLVDQFALQTGADV